jgi:aspartate 1-decarboxylase
MENLSNIQKNEITKKEFEYEKEKCRLNLRKNKLAEILSSKRRKIINNENDKKIKNYSIQLEDIINNIPNEYKIDINLFLDNVRIFILFYFYI